MKLYIYSRSCSFIGKHPHPYDKLQNTILIYTYQRAVFFSVPTIKPCLELLQTSTPTVSTGTSSTWVPSFHPSLPAYVCSQEKAQQEFLQWDDLPLPDGLPPENMLFSEYSNCEATPMNTGRQNLPNASERSTMSSPVSGIGGYSPKKSSTALVVGELYKIIREHIPNIFTEKTISKPRSSTCFPNSTKRVHRRFRTETPKYGH